MSAFVDDGALCARGCDRVHQLRERKVPCRDCGRPTEDVHRICDACWLERLAAELEVDTS